MLVALTFSPEQDLGFATAGIDSIAYNQLPPDQIAAFANSPGVDSILLLGGDDTAIDDGGSRVYFGNAGNDFLVGNGGSDTLIAGRDEDEVRGSEGDDFLSGNIGDDFVVGGDGNDTLFGGKNEDRLLGEAGNDTLSGDLGNDTLEGGIGDDLLTDSSGVNVLTGGRGADAFTIARNNSFNTITDFNPAQGDILTFEGLTLNDVTFSFNGTNTVVTDNLTNLPVAVILGVNLVSSPPDIFTRLEGGSNSEDNFRNGTTTVQPSGGWQFDDAPRVITGKDEGDDNWEGASDNLQIVDKKLTLEVSANPNNVEVITLQLPADSPANFSQDTFFTLATENTTDITFETAGGDGKTATLFLLPNVVTIPNDVSGIANEGVGDKYTPTAIFSIINGTGILAINLQEEDGDTQNDTVSLSITGNLGLRPLSNPFVEGGVGLFQIDPTADDRVSFTIVDND